MKIELLCVLFFPLSVIRFKGLCVGRHFSRTAQSVFGVILRRSNQNDFSPEAVNGVRQGTGNFRLGTKSDKGLNTRLSIKTNNKIAVCAF